MMPRSGAAAEAVPLGDPALPYWWQWTRAPDRTRRRQPRSGRG